MANNDNNDDDKKFKEYKKLVVMTKYIDYIIFDFRSPETASPPPDSLTAIVKTALDYPDCCGVFLKLTKTLEAGPSKFRFNEYLKSNGMNDDGDEGRFTYRDIFENFFPAVAEDVDRYQRVLLRKLNNDHFSVQFFQHVRDVNAILRYAFMEENYFNVRIEKKCSCDFPATCSSIPPLGTYSYSTALELFERMPDRRRPSFDLRTEQAFPIITHSRKHFFTFS